MRALFAAFDADSFVYVDSISMIQLPDIARKLLSGMGSAYAMLSAELLPHD